MAGIITGYTGEPHVTSRDDAAFQKIAGLGYVFLKQNSNDDPIAVATSDGKIQMPKMDLLMQGVHCKILGNEIITLDVGSQGVYRIDVICGKYSKDNSTQVEKFEIEVVKGASAGSNPKDPTLIQGDISYGETCYCPLFAVALYGNNIQSIVRKINGFRTIEEIDTWINNNNATLNNIGAIKTTADNALAKANTNATNIAKKIGTYDLILRTFSVDNVTIKSGVVYAQRFNVGVSGYTCLGVIGFNVQNASSGGVASTGCNISIAWLETSTTAMLNIRNEVTSDAKVKITVQCLYVRNA